MLFIIRLEALPREMRWRCSELLLYDKNVKLLSVSFNGLKRKLELWKVAKESKGRKERLERRTQERLEKKVKCSGAVLRKVD